MKRFGILSALIIFFLSSCSKETYSDKVNFLSIPLELEAEFILNNSKTIIDTTSIGSILWSPNEEISVHYYDDGTYLASKFISTNDSPVSATVFKGSIQRSSFFSPTELDSAALAYCAIYPYSEDNVFNGTEFILNVPKDQNALHGSFSPGQFPSIARTYGHILSFWNICGGLSFTLTNPNIKTIKFTSNNGKALAGRVKATFSEERPIVTGFESDSSSTIYLSAPESLTFTPGVRYYVSMVPGIFSEGISITFFTDSTKADLVSLKTLPIVRSEFKSLTDIDKDLPFPVRVQSIEIDSDFLRIPIDSNRQLKASILPSDAENKHIIWKSMDETIATVSPEGLVTAITKGKCKIVATSLENEFVCDTCIVEAFRPVSEVRFNQKAFEILPGKTLQLIASVLPEDASCDSLVWYSTDELIASVSSNGLVTANDLGECKIIVSSADDVTKRDTCSISVIVPVTSITIRGESNLEVGYNQTFTATVLPQEAKYKGVVWSSSDSLTAKVSQSGEVTPLKAGVCTIKAESEKDSTVFSTIQITILKVVALDDGGHYANCYIVPCEGTYDFAPVRGISGQSIGSVSEAKVLWEFTERVTGMMPKVGDLIPSVEIKKDRIRFTTPSQLKSGNAVIAAKDANGKVLWSWHIWIAEGYDIESAKQLYNTGDYLMDRHLGAISTGTSTSLVPLYQWGRKDPFVPDTPPTEFSSVLWPSPVESDETTGTIEYAVSNPMTFLTCDIYGDGDWYYSEDSMKSSRWSSSKTEYDPCPYGWKVPTGGPNGFWKSAAPDSKKQYYWNYSNFGASLSNVFGLSIPVWYQATGFMDEYEGKLMNETYTAELWSSSVQSSSAYKFYISTSSNYVGHYSTNKARGCAVRCIKEK